MFRLTLVLGLLAGCAGMSPPPASPADATRAKVELAELRDGRSLLLSKCGGCHRVPLPADHRAHEWPTKIHDMSARAHVDDQERRLIEEYLVTMAAH